ncbi:hypothetical protein G7K71_18335 [Desulfofundulus sp. TPOSR]|uniref:hypothetical protein n=1 Tax=Desulfofundulus sp. TPOSR TaxID=2714340 RepID=UPI0014090C5E|nr:hypothetical protein [Desulfofundulus sp. TPOSR]NHM28882.1 hypothetical protein [Desulfofundulus sp. TPOSR]
MGRIKENTTDSSKIMVEHKKSEYTVVHVFPANTEDSDERLKKFKRQVVELILASAPYVSRGH